MRFSRRGFLATSVGAPLLTAAVVDGQSGSSAPGDTFPAHDPKAVAEMVTAAHTDVNRVRELLSNRPALANAGWDWGFGDWETPLAAASHMGNREIAAVLLAAGARPTLFSAAMLGQLDVVKAFITSMPGVQRTRGPHGITLLAHAKAGNATEVVKYLEAVPDSNEAYSVKPLADTARTACAGTYVFGEASTQAFVVSVTERGALLIHRVGRTDQVLLHVGDMAFHPAGAEHVRLRFAAGEPAPSLMIEDGPVVITARRQ